MESKQFLIGKKFRCLHRIIKNRFQEHISDLGLTTRQIEVLKFLFRNQNQELNQKAIEEEFDLSHPTVTGILKRLESRDFIKRKPDEKDARNKIVVLSEKSLKLRSDLESFAEETEKILTENISDSELATFMSVLDKMVSNLKNGE